MTAPLRIANASGFYGDRASAMHEQLSGGEIDVLTGDYLAELTMLILARDRAKDPPLGYACGAPSRSFATFAPATSSVFWYSPSGLNSTSWVSSSNSGR